MQWQALPRGSFTGIDWSAPGAIDGADPYLVWAETDHFAGYGGKTPARLPLAIALKPGVTIAQLAAATAQTLRIPPVYTSASAPAGLRYCTGRARPAFFRDYARVQHLIERIELGLPAGPHDDGDDAPRQDRPAATSNGQRAQPPQLLSGTVLGLIDDSLALAHANFLRGGGQARTAFFWRQDDEGKGRVPQGLGYGLELGAADIDAAMAAHRHGGLVDESAVYTALGLSQMGRHWPRGRVPFHALDTAVSHGSHVADLAAGPRTLRAQVANLPPGFDAPPSWALANDASSRSPIVAVQLDYDTVADTSGGSMNVGVLDGLMYVLSRCAPDACVVVNVSFGTIAGPHDGSALLEAAMDQLRTLCGERLQIVLPAGNSYQSRTHANCTLPPAGQQALHWRVLPDDSSQSFLEIWLPPGARGVEITVTPPGRAALPPMRLGGSGMWADAAGRPHCALIYPASVATGRNGTCALLALARTFSLDGKHAVAPHGPWKVDLVNTGAAPVTLDAYVERDDTVLGVRAGARQSHLEDDPRLPYGQQYDMQARVDDPARATPIRRSGSFNSIATGANTLSVGGVRLSDTSPAWYSPRLGDPGRARPQRPGVVMVPDREAPSDDNPALIGLSAAGTRSTAVVRLAGTSDAAPQVARELLDACGSRATSAPAASS